MGRKKKSETEAPAEGASTGTAEVKTKADAFRAAVAEGLSSPKEISEYVKSKYNMEMSAGMVSAYKSLEKNKGKKKSAKKVTRARTAADAKPSGFETGNGLMASLESVKMLVKHHGADQVKRMVDLFA